MNKLLLLFASLIFIFSCTVNTDENPILAQFSFPQDCCRFGTGIFILQDSLDASRIEAYLASVIISDNEDFEHSYYPQTNKRVRLVENFEIIDEENNLVFRNTNFLPNDPFQGWNGKINGINAEGKFLVNIQVRSLEGSVIRYEKFICALLCSQSFDLYLDQGMDFRECMWPIQHDGNGGFDISAPPPFCF